MRKKYEYELILFSRDNKIPSKRLESFLNREKARSKRLSLLKTLNSNLSIRIDKKVRSQKVFKQSTIYDFGV